MTAKALEMSLRYGFVTPLTSMVVTKPESESGSPLIADKLTESKEIYNVCCRLTQNLTRLPLEQCCIMKIITFPPHCFAEQRQEAERKTGLAVFIYTFIFLTD